MELAEYLSWDSRHFRKRIGRIRVHALDEAGMHAVLVWAEDEQIECLYYLVDGDQPQAAWLAEQAGFHLVDVRITLTYRPDHPGVYKSNPTAAPAGVSLRPAGDHDVQELENLAAGSFTTTRFFVDPHFSRADSARMYERWVNNNLQDPTGRVIVAERGHQIAGFISLGQGFDTGRGSIELLVTHPETRGLGVGQALIRCAQEWLEETGLTGLRVVTQGSNQSAQRAYQRAGFLTENLQLWYHKWFTQDS